MNIESLDMHISLLSRQRDAVWLDPEACQRSLQRGVLKLELSTAGELNERDPSCVGAGTGAPTLRASGRLSLHVLEPHSLLDAGTVQDGV